MSITAYTLIAGRVVHTVQAADAALPAGTVWVDIQDANGTELAQFSQLTKIRLPLLRDVRLMEQARQQYVDHGTTYLAAPIIIGSQSDNPHSGTLLFVLNPQLLITVRAGDSRAISLFSERLTHEPALLQNSKAAFLGLLETIVQRLADLSEIIGHELEQVSQIVFHESLQRSMAPGRGKPTSWRRIMVGLGKSARLNHRLLTTLTGLDRILLFLQSPDEPCIGEASYPQLRVMQMDLQRLIDQANATINESTFLLDAIVGAITIEQNKVVKIFSMVAVILMPPTMIASIYGMNFAHMPELAWPAGYPLALIAMLLSAVLPWWWFRRSGWF